MHGNAYNTCYVSKAVILGTADAKLAAAAIAGSVITGEETAAAKSSVYRADDGALLPAGQGNVGDGVAGANDAFKAVFGCFSSDLQGVEMPISDLFRSDGQVRPKTLAPVLGVEDLPPFRSVTSDVREGLGINREGSRNVMPSGVVRGSWVTADAITVDSGVHLISGPAGGVLVDANKVATGDSVGDIIDAADCAKSGRAANKVAVGSLIVQSTGPTRPRFLGESRSPVLAEDFIGGRFMGHGCVRASVPVTSGRSSIKRSRSLGVRKISLDFVCHWGPNPTKDTRSIWNMRSLKREVPRTGLRAGLGCLPPVLGMSAVHARFGISDANDASSANADPDGFSPNLQVPIGVVLRTASLLQQLAQLATSRGMS